MPLIFAIYSFKLSQRVVISLFPSGTRVTVKSPFEISVILFVALDTGLRYLRIVKNMITLKMASKIIAVTKVMTITLVILLPTMLEETALTTTHEVPSISVAVNIIAPAPVFTVRVLFALSTLVFILSNTVASPFIMGSVVSERFCPTISALELTRISFVSLLMM